MAGQNSLCESWAERLEAYFKTLQKRDEDEDENKDNVEDTPPSPSPSPPPPSSSPSPSLSLSHDFVSISAVATAAAKTSGGNNTTGFYCYHDVMLSKALRAQLAGPDKDKDKKSQLSFDLRNTFSSSPSSRSCEDEMLPVFVGAAAAFKETAWMYAEIPPAKRIKFSYDDEEASDEVKVLGLVRALKDMHLDDDADSDSEMEMDMEMESEGDSDSDMMEIDIPPVKTDKVDLSSPRFWL